MSKLNACPFCGGAEKQQSRVTGVKCRGCGAWGPESSSAIDWNTRHIPEGYKLVPIEPTEAMIDELEAQPSADPTAYVPVSVDFIDKLIGQFESSPTSPAQREWAAQLRGFKDAAALQQGDE